MALAAPDERRRMPIPALDGVGEPAHERLGVSRMLTRERPPLDDALQRLGHVEPGTSGRCPEQEDAVLGTPLHQARALVPGQIVQDEQHPHGWEKAIQLFGGRIDIPVLPASTLWDHFWSSGTLLENGLKFALEPGVQDRIGGVFHRLGTDFARRWSQ